MSEDFCNLHVHSHSSLIDGLGKPAEIVARAKKLGNPAIAITDHGTLAGVPDMYRECKKQGVQCIVGQEFYIVPDAQTLGFGTTGNEKDGRNFHLTMVAKNEKGYRDLVKLTSWAHDRANFHRKPRIDHAMLEQVDTENLICMSGCVMGELSESFLNVIRPLAERRVGDKYDQWKPVRKLDHPLIDEGVEAAREVMKFYRDLFPDGQYLYEFMYHNFAPESWVHTYLIPEAKRYGIPIVATNDSHYVGERQSEAHNLLMSIQWKQQYCARPDDPKHLDIVSGKKLRKRMADLVSKKDITSGIENSLYVAELCKGFKITPLEKKHTYMPKAREDNGTVIDKPVTNIIALSERRLRGLCERTPDRATEYRDRFDRELRTIKKLKYQHYFLATAGIVRWAKEQGIVVGAGRGSGAGSLVAFCLGITEIDPVAHDLLFERFLNPAKKSLPDFDIDFESDRIEEVFEHIVNVYGADNVRRVSTYHRYAPKALMTDLLKFLPTGMAHDEIKEITKDLPEDTRDRKDEGFMETWWHELRGYTDMSKDGKVWTEGNSDKAVAARRLLHVADKFPIEAYSKDFYGIRKSVSTHAAGVIITNDKMSISDWVPNQLVVSTNKTVTQFDMNDLADMGFVKFDILSLGTLSQIAECFRLLGGSPFPEFMDYKDDKTYELITKGHTDGMFQLSGYAAKQVIKQIGGCYDFEDIVAVTALCRPGAGKFVGDYKKGRENPDSVNYASDADKEILGRSYGVVLYQEQVMSLGWAIGMTDEEVSGDISLLSAIKKYSATLMDQVEPMFRSRAKTAGWEKAMIDLRWQNIHDYVGYGFNRNHAVSYSDTSFQTAYLKANHPAEFIVSRLNQTERMSDKKKKAELKQALVQDARRNRVKVRPPSVNKSQVSYSIQKGAIRWGLANVKGVGIGAAREIIKNRPFEAEDWVTDAVGPRGGKIDPYLRGVEKQKCNSAAVKALIEVGAFPGFDPGEDRFGAEFERLECNVSEHHNKKVLKQIKKRVLDNDNMKMHRKRKAGEYECLVGGVIHRVKEITTKGGRKMAFVDIMLGEHEFSLTVFSDLWEGQMNYRKKQVDQKGISGKVKRGRLIYAHATRRFDGAYGWGCIASDVKVYR